MAPEQRLGAGTDARSDVYAIGRILSDVLGDCEPPFDGLASLVRACTRDAVDERPPDAAAVAHELERWLTGHAARERAMALVVAARELAARSVGTFEEARRVLTLARDHEAELPARAALDTLEPLWNEEYRGRRLLEDAEDLPGKLPTHHPDTSRDVASPGPRSRRAPTAPPHARGAPLRRRVRGRGVVPGGRPEAARRALGGVAGVAAVLLPAARPGHGPGADGRSAGGGSRRATDRCGATGGTRPCTR